VDLSTWPTARPTRASRHRPGTWNPDALGPEGGNGPGGNRAGAGAIIQRTNNGRTDFSVDDRTGNFRDSEGYFEFDASIG